jgi:hypothetical protein
MRGYGLKLMFLALLSIVTMDAYAADVLAWINSGFWAIFWDKKLYIPFGLVAVGVNFRIGR